MHFGGINISKKTVLVSMLASIVSSLICCMILASLIFSGKRSLDPKIGGAGIPEPGTGSASEVLKRTDKSSETSNDENDTDPIDSLIVLFTTGDAEYAGKVFHPESLERITAAIEGFRDTIKGNGRVMRTLIGALIPRISSGIEPPTDISYTVLERNAVEGTELDDIRDRYASQGYSLIPEDARKLTLKVIVKTKSGDKTTELSPTVVRVGESWYLDITGYEIQTSLDIASRIFLTMMSLASTTPFRLVE